MFWDYAAAVYDLFVNVVNRKTHKKLRSIISGLIEPGDRVLECACGTGMLSAVIAEKGASLTATDFSRKMLKKAMRNCRTFSNIRFERADITDLRYPDGSFDKVIAGNVIHLLDDPLAALKELDRTCRPGGTLIIPTYMEREKRSGRAPALRPGIFRQHFTVRSYRKFFLDAGYPDVRIKVAEGRIPCAVAVMQKKKTSNAWHQ